MSKRRIKQVVVLGSGIMGSRIACHFANIGIQVLLLDIVPKELNEKEKKLNADLNETKVRNRIVNDSLNQAIKSNPSPLYSKSFSNYITTGNFEDDISKLKDADWIIEVVVENLEVKKEIFDLVESNRKVGSIVSSNTSGIPINSMTKGRSEDFKIHFLGTHFFNPPRYLELLEIIPANDTSSEVVDFMMDYGKRYLGKKTVLCKDTPAFIANRIGVFSIMSLFHKVIETKLSIEEVDALTGPVLGRPKSATFRTCDVVGLDTLVRVSNGVHSNSTTDESLDTFIAPEFINKMIDSKLLGDKTKKGFYEKRKDKNGKSIIYALDLNSLEYREKQKVRFDSISEAKKQIKLEDRFKILLNHSDRGGQFLREIFYEIFSYISYRIPEISDDLYSIDDALKAGFGWQMGPFESWDTLGVKDTFQKMQTSGVKLAPWIGEMISDGHESFYKIFNGQQHYYDPNSKNYLPINSQSNQISFKPLKQKNKALWENKGSSIWDLGDGVIQLEFHSKMNTIGQEIIQGINTAIDMAEKNHEALVIYNEGQNFSVGADVGMIFMMAVEQDYDELAFAISLFQKTMMRIRYSAIPVIVATHQMCLGGGCELSMHADKVIAHAETYMGLVEFGVGVIPGGGGTKEFALRLSDEIKEGDIRTNAFRKRFLTIGQAKVATSAYEAFELGYLRKGIDEVCINRELQLSTAKRSALELIAKGYSQPIERKDIKVLGNEAMGLVYAGANAMQSGNYISEHDQLISEKLGYVLAGGDLSEISMVSEKYLLDLERKAFIELCATRKTLERLQSMITKGKVLRN